MIMTVRELYEALCAIIPSSLSCEWDRDGLECCPEPEREVKRIIVALDVTDKVIDTAICENADVIVSHHPIFFGGLSGVNSLTVDGAKAVKLVKANIATMSFHTRLDALCGGVNDTLAALIGLRGVEVIGSEGIARIGELERELDAMAFAEYVKKALSCGEGEKEAHVALCPAGKAVKRVALVGGSGGSDIKLAYANGADTYLTGELKHHERLMAAELGINLLAAGHFFTEYPVCAFIEKTLKGICPNANISTVFSNTVIEL